MTILPIVCFGVVWLVFQKTSVATNWRSAFLAAAMVWGLLVTAITEGLSLFRLLGYWGVLAGWAVATGAAALILVRGPGRLNLKPHLSLAGLARFEQALLGVMAVIVIVVGVTAWIAAPNTWDSMTYHMSRVMHWIQNGSVADYPTHILRQLHQNPWAEFAILQFQVLSGTDRWANLVQWFSMLGSAIGISLVAQQLGAGRRGQIFAAVIALTIPMGILQGSSTQNDYVVSFWLVCLAYFLLRLRTTSHGRYVGAVGACLGFAILTKPTAYLYALPFMAWLSLSLVKTRRLQGWLQVGLIVTTAVIINFGQYARNYNLYGNPLGPSEELGGYTYANNGFSVAATTSNLLRNLGLHLGLPFPEANEALESGFYGLFRAIGLDPNDPRTTWRDTEFHIVFFNDENVAGNPIHLVFIGVAIAIIGGGARKQRAPAYYALCLAGAFVVFCFYLRWQPWNSRLHLPLFILGSALVGLLLEQIKTQRIANWCLLILLVGADPALPLVLNQTRPLVGPASIFVTSRTAAYFSGRREIGRPYVDAADFLKATACTEVGLMLGGDDYEYPLWPLLNEPEHQAVRLEHVNVTNQSARLAETAPFSTFRPCAVLVIASSPPDTVEVRDVTLERAWLSAPVSVFLEAAPAP